MSTNTDTTGREAPSNQAEQTGSHDRPASTPVAGPIPDWPAARPYGDQLEFPVVFMRGGTSRGAYIRASDLPTDPQLRDRVILALYGSPDVRQIDGIGGANPLTSKLAIVSPSNRPDADVDYLFAQVGVDKPVVDFGGNCGNMLAGVGPFAIDEGLIPADGELAKIRIFNVNTGRVITAEVPILDGHARSAGATAIAGVPRAGARILLDFANAGGVLGKGLLPTGQASERLTMPDGREFEVSIVDAANPTVFVRAIDLGLEMSDLLSAEPPEGGIERLRQIRAAAAARLGLASSPEAASVESPGIPKAYAVGPPLAYKTLNGRSIESRGLSIVGRGLSFGAPHNAYASSVAICTAVAARLPSTVVCEVCAEAEGTSQVILIGHPGGTFPVEVAVDQDADGNPVLIRAGIVRTARRLLSGMATVPREVLG